MTQETWYALLLAIAYFALVLNPSWPPLLLCAGLYGGLVVWNVQRGRGRRLE